VEKVRTIIIPKETSWYRIVTSNPDNWRAVANRPFVEGEALAPEDASFHIDVCGIEFVDVILEPTQERKRIFTEMSAVPNDAGCAPNALEFPWCFVNHSCEPNTRDQWVSEIPALLANAVTLAERAIAKGEEFTYDYALEQYDYKNRCACSCGAASCRGRLGGFNNLSNDQQSRLLSRASPLVQEKYRRRSVVDRVGSGAIGRHLLVDYWDCDTGLLNDAPALSTLLTQAAQEAGATVLSTHVQTFEHMGVTAIAILAESHISIHTWPEARYAAVDIYTCGDCDPIRAHEFLVAAIPSSRFEFVELARGQEGVQRSISKISHVAHDGPAAKDDDAWFFEDTVPGRRFGNINHGFIVSEEVFKGRTNFQDCMIFDNPVYGRVLALDGIVQLSTFDEHIYHEMLVHPAMFAHPNPRRVVIVGGGDGGTLREVLRHDPEQVVMIDIDEQFVRHAAQHLPTLSAGSFEDPRVTLVFEDASDALRHYENAFDVAIIDCNDAIGPSEVLFHTDFYATVARSLAGQGTTAVQAGSLLDTDFLQKVYRRMASHLGSTIGFRLTIPCYHCGEYAFFVSSKVSDPSGPDISALEQTQVQRGVKTKYWTPAIHHAAQLLPPGSALW